MRSHLLLAATVALALASPAAAQTGGQPPRTDPAPWWMAQPVVSSIGYVRFELRANRANFSASFQTVERTAADATKAATAQVRTLSEQLRAYGAERVRVTTTVSIEPLYDQYRDRTGAVQENQRADRIERFAARAFVSVEVRDLGLLERVYASALAARPASITGVGFRLEPGDEVRTALYVRAVEDAQTRARRSAEAAGARLGAVKMIDPTGRACETDVLAGRSSRQGDNVLASDVGEIVVTGARLRSGDAPPPPAAPPPPPPPPPALAEALPPELQALALQPPLIELTSRACVVYALG